MKPSLSFLCLLLFACSDVPEVPDQNTLKQEILQTERSFARMVQERGMHQAFVAFAAENAVLMRNNDLIIGKENIDRTYQNQDEKGLSWEPEFIDVAASGDLAYTYGYYTYSHIDSAGAHETKGVFHTVWKRQPDGNWKFVWD